MNQLERYSTLDAILKAHPDLDAKDQALLLWIARSEHTESGWVKGFYKDVAKAAAQGSTKTLQRHVKKLEKLGVIHVVRRYNPKRNRHLATLFRLAPPKPAPLETVPDAYLAKSKFHKFESGRVYDMAEAGRKHPAARKYIIFHANQANDPTIRATFEKVATLMNHRSNR